MSRALAGQRHVCSSWSRLAARLEAGPTLDAVAPAWHVPAITYFLPDRHTHARQCTVLWMVLVYYYMQHTKQ